MIKKNLYTLGGGVLTGGAGGAVVCGGCVGGGLLGGVGPKNENNVIQIQIYNWCLVLYVSWMLKFLLFVVLRKSFIDAKNSCYFSNPFKVCPW